MLRSDTALSNNKYFKWKICIEITLYHYFCRV
ncbi:hypothetical protein Bache_2270 [Bacteroides helcogenes P 36-108]|uniref:Uncharacterized protein n=1 Tax=Bacteroides helcogenes (strain ATCC 35417 / DSM 20613 / JCM 6297 / CCUG 15421 / P 36-108) TaxID=693979 RepID=E6ST08_BACT6|nr:hypothetical protein Bache_2270 [Bacteroides helcogenes P 36-108]